MVLPSLVNINLLNVNVYILFSHFVVTNLIHVNGIIAVI
jgi:hypothetical protein